ncbi:helix-turn-helix domain-containing protein [Burkholderia cepacia]|nr:helix-turn-helix domain-containing protein [Burkholderia cepacia]
MAWGFNNASHFSRTFRRHFGVSARDYRAKHRDVS